NAATIQGTLDSLAPREQTLKRALGTLAVDNMQRFTATRLANLDHGDLDGTLAIIGNPLVFAASRASGDVVASGAALAANDTALRPGKLP
ncbi:hypothetical protein AAEQ95_14185, partial [Pseudomonas aeruginosa]